MTAAQHIQTYRKIQPLIYCYSTPGVAYHEGWVKIGYTESQTAEERIAQQTRTANIRTQLEWQEHAQYKTAPFDWFKDHDFHKYLSVEREVERESGTEWFHLAASQARSYFNDFADKKTPWDQDKHFEYTLRKEQQEAVDKTRKYFKSEDEGEFLWNAKPRFGKTLAAYDLVRTMGFQKVLIVTNRPSIANSWLDDFNKFIGWRGELCFVSSSDALKGQKGVMTREQYVDLRTPVSGRKPGMVAFESLQGLKGSVYFGGDYRKLQWMAREYRDNFGNVQHGQSFDLLIVDESHEGVDTILTEKAFENIDRKYTLYLSGTPFKALADGRFDDDQIFNWTYVDEQGARESWDGEEYNPYEELPRLAMFTYQLSNMLYDRLERGVDLSDDENVDYAFDLNEFFKTNEAGKFLYEAEIKKFLHALSTQEKYPFSTPELRGELAHTLWLLDRVASAKALARLLAEDPVFREYKVVLAAGDGSTDGTAVAKNSFKRVGEAIKENARTITLSVGQLTVGVTIPEWSGVLMLCNMQSPASYMQAAFRAQNRHSLTRIGADGRPERVRKETAYVFDFDPARTLIIFDEFANNLSPDTAAGRGTSEARRERIGKLLNFFPVLGEDEEGRMVELNADEVLSIPRRLKSAEVVRRGFMSNFLFQNISNVFGAPALVQEIIGKLTPAQEELRSRSRENGLEHIGEVPVDENGKVKIPGEIVIGKTRELFGPKVYEKLKEAVDPALDKLNPDPGRLRESVKAVADTIKETVIREVVHPAAESSKVSSGARKRLERQVSHEIDRKLEAVQDDFLQRVKIAGVERENALRAAETPAEQARTNSAYESAMTEAKSNFLRAVDKVTEETLQNKPAEVVQKMEEWKAEEKKKGIEDSVREHLRGFSRTVPSFIMAYGDNDLTLANFDEYTEDDVFQEVTGISEEDFRFLRDGGDYKDPVTGRTEHFAGHLFDETVFDDSVKEFLKKKEELADYFDESHTEDIFDYIPPQKTNQIFTPRRVVKKMVDALEQENPGCFDNPDYTFADLYMKSGLYITEIVKRLYNSQGLKADFPDDRERILHILRRQVYGMAPTRIIYLIATNYILGFDEALKAETRNFVEADAAEAAKNGTLQDLVNRHFAG